MTTKTAEESYGYLKLKRLPRETTLYTILRRVSRSGMTRILDIKVIEENKPRNVIVLESRYCAKNSETESRWGGNYRVGGCGMDMGFWLVYNLGILVHQDGYYFRHEWL